MLSQAGLAVGTGGRLHQPHGAVALAGTIQAGDIRAVGASRALARRLSARRPGGFRVGSGAGLLAGEGLQMSAFTVELDNQPDELARLCEAMASSGVNLLLCATTHGNSGLVAFIADDEAAAKRRWRARTSSS
jgi:hypothetical protein